MYRKSCLFIVSLLVSASAIAQIDYETIRMQVTDKESQTYYPVLLDRFNQSDSTLSADDFTLLYYGAVFLSSYDLYQIQEQEQKIRLANYDQEFLLAYELADQLLKNYPMSVQAYFEKAYACFNLKRFKEESYNNKRYKILIRTVLASGDGKSFETAFHANLPNDEYEVLKSLGLEIKEATEVEYLHQSFDLFKLKPNKKKWKETFFNITRQERKD